MAFGVAPNESAIPWIFGDDTTLSPGLFDNGAGASAADTLPDVQRIGWSSELTRMTMVHKLVSTTGVWGRVCTHSETARPYQLRWLDHPVPGHVGMPDVQGSALAELTVNLYCKILLFTKI